MIITLTGPNNYELKLARQKIVQTYQSEYSDVNFEQFDGSEVDLETLLGAVQSTPFLATKRLVVVRALSENKEVGEKIDLILESTANTTDLVLVEPKFDKRTVYYKTLKKKTDFKEFNELDERQLPRWLVSEASARGGSLSPSDAQYLVSQAGDDQERLSNELDKLLTYQPNISHGSIDELIEPSPSSTVFALLESAFAGQQYKAIKLYRDQRLQKVEPQQIVAMLAWQLHILALVKTAVQRSSSDIAREAKLNPFVVQKTLTLARHISMDQLKTMLGSTLELDVKLKSQKINPDDALEHYLLTLLD